MSTAPSTGTPSERLTSLTVPKELRVISVSRRVAQVYAPTLLSAGEPGAEPSRNRLYINLVMVKKPEGWQIVSILPILVPPQ